jgi:hypothetical protein
LIVEVDPFI